MKKGTDKKERKKLLSEKDVGIQKEKRKVKYILNLYNQRRMETERGTKRQYILFSQSLSNKIQF